MSGLQLQPLRSMVNMKFSISTWNYLVTYGERADLFDAVDRIVQQGFGLELFLDWHAAPELLDRGNWPSITKICRNSVGLSLHSRLFHFFDNDIIREEIDLCHYLEGDILVVHPRSLGLNVGTLDYTSAVEPDEHDFERIVEILRYAKTQGVCLSLENGPMDILKCVRDRLKEETDITNFGICLDTGHANLHQDRERTSILQMFEEFRKDLVHVHISDNFGKIDEHNLPGNGNIDWPLVISYLEDIKYTGRLVFELHTPDPSESGDRARELISKFGSNGE